MWVSMSMAKKNVVLAGQYQSVVLEDNHVKLCGPVKSAGKATRLSKCLDREKQLQ